MNNAKLAGYMAGYMHKEAFFGVGMDVGKRVGGWSKRTDKGLRSLFKRFVTPAIKPHADEMAEQIIDDKLNSTDAMLGSAGVGGLLGAGVGSAIGSAYADDQSKSKLPNMGYGALMGGGAGALTGMALMALLRHYRKNRKK